MVDGLLIKSGDNRYYSGGLIDGTINMDDWTALNVKGLNK